MAREFVEKALRDHVRDDPIADKIPEEVAQQIAYGAADSRRNGCDHDIKENILSFLEAKKHQYGIEGDD